MPMTLTLVVVSCIVQYAMAITFHAIYYVNYRSSLLFTHLLYFHV